jgi:hypothetical protein
MNNWRGIFSYITEKKFEPGARVRFIGNFIMAEVHEAGAEGVIVGRGRGRDKWFVRFDNYPRTASDAWGEGFVSDGLSVHEEDMELI